jgi:hypothetical protein
MTPTDDLPLLDPVRSIPTVGNPIAELLQPDLKVLVNLGYGNPDFGYSADADGPLAANVPTPFGLFPDIDPSTVLKDLADGAQQGISDFEGDLSNLSMSTASDTSSLPDVMDPSSAAASFTDVVNAISSAASSAYATLLPTTDILNALVTSLPTYDATLFADNLQSGDVLDAFCLPLAADTALFTLAAGFELQIVTNAASDINDAFSDLSP